MRGVLTALVAVLALAAPAAAGTPVLRVADIAPVVVKGHGFKAGESVKVVLVLGHVKVRKTVAASAEGRFVARFPLRSIEPCEPHSVRAVGSRGSVAVARARPTAPCAPLSD